MNDAPPDNVSFEQALAELERIVHDMEDGQVGLEESLARYEKGIALLKRCYGQLRQAEQRIMLLTGVDAEEKPLARPFEHTASAEQAERKPAEPPPEKPANSQRKRVETPELPF